MSFESSEVEDEERNNCKKEGGIVDDEDKGHDYDGDDFGERM